MLEHCRQGGSLRFIDTGDSVLDYALISMDLNLGFRAGTTRFDGITEDSSSWMALVFVRTERSAFWRSRRGTPPTWNSQRGRPSAAPHCHLCQEKYDR